MTLFASVESDPALFGSTVLVLIAVVSVVCVLVSTAINVWTALHKPKEKPDLEYVTRGEMNRELDRLEENLKTLDRYVHEATHGMNGRLHTINLRIVFLMGLLTQLCSKQGIAVPPEPTISAPDEA